MARLEPARLLSKLWIKSIAYHLTYHILNNNEHDEQIEQKLFNFID